MKCTHILVSAHHAVQGAGGIEDYVQEHVRAWVGQQLEAQGVRAAVLLPAALAVRQQHSRQCPQRCWQQLCSLCCLLHSRLLSM